MRRLGISVLVCCALIGTVQAEVLTLEMALAAASEPHPDWRIAESEVQVARAEQAAVSSRQDFTLYLDGQLRSGRRPDDHWKPDNTGRLIARKPLLDFGRSRGALEVAEQEIATREAALLSVESLRRLDIMARYFDVLLADMQYAADNEFMAVAYVARDNARDRLDVGQINRPDFLRREAEFQDRRERRELSLQRVRSTRQQLAHAINRPGALPDELAEPLLRDNARAIPEYDSLLAWVMQNNPRVRGLKAQLAAAEARLLTVRTGRYPVLDAEIQGAGYSRESATRDDISAGLVFSVPLYQGGRLDAEEARARALRQRAEADLDKLRFELSDAVLEAMQEISWLRETARGAADTQIEFRDWVLERARAEYELEMQTSLGTSMAETQLAQLRRKQVEYRLALALARLDALSGGRLPNTEGNQK
ncbi:MAG: TolC family protein [Thiobacillus sp.]